jgi:hypothetical protein
MWPIHCPRTSAKDYRLTLRNIPEECRSHPLYHGWICSGNYLCCVWTTKQNFCGVLYLQTTGIWLSDTADNTKPNQCADSLWKLRHYTMHNINWGTVTTTTYNAAWHICYRGHLPVIVKSVMPPLTCSTREDAWPSLRHCTLYSVTTPWAFSLPRGTHVALREVELVAFSDNCGAAWGTKGIVHKPVSVPW